jgi:hypothetical protein
MRRLSTIAMVTLALAAPVVACTGPSDRETRERGTSVGNHDGNDDSGFATTNADGNVISCDNQVGDAEEGFADVECTER